MEIETLFGLPAHPLIVHVPIVLVPLSAVGAVLMCWPFLRAKIGWVWHRPAVEQSLPYLERYKSACR